MSQQCFIGIGFLNEHAEQEPNIKQENGDLSS